jgi:hypothetical protein
LGTVTIVAGPPCAGKTTYVLERAKPGDLIVDHDLIAQDLGSPVAHHHGRAMRDQAEAWVFSLLAEIMDGLHETAWVVRCLPDVSEREAWARDLNAEVVLLDPGRTVVYARANARPRASSTRWAIDKWYARSERVFEQG